MLLTNGLYACKILLSIINKKSKRGNFMSNFQKNLKTLSQLYTQKYIAEKTGFSQSSINNYLTKQSEPSIQFLIALKNAFGICTDDFLFSDISIRHLTDERFGNLKIITKNAVISDF